MRSFVAVALAAAILVGGCAKPADRSAPDLGPAIGRARAATADLADRAIRLGKNLAALRGTSAEIRDALRGSAVEGRALLPDTAPPFLVSLCDHLDAQAARIDAAILPTIDEALKGAEAIQAGTAVLSGPVLDELLAAETQVGELAARAERAEARAEQLEREKDDAIYKLLVCFILVGVVGTAGGVAVALFSQWTKLGAGVAVMSFILFGTASALWRWLNEIQWTMLGLMAAGLAVVVVLLVLAIRRNWKSFAQVVQGGQDWKSVIEGLAKKSREELLALFQDTKVLRKLFNETQQAAQDAATQAMVVQVKKANGDGNVPETKE